VKWLFDQNLSPRLVEALADLFPGSAHVQSLGLDQSPDTPVWDCARDSDFTVVSKDADFSDRSALLGHPPKVIWLRLGNASTPQIEPALRKHHEWIAAFGEDEELGVFAIFG
jgi:predicted nuclease of predicted toxin-antitoxin system